MNNSLNFKKVAILLQCWIFSILGFSKFIPFFGIKEKARPRSLEKETCCQLSSSQLLAFLFHWKDVNVNDCMIVNVMTYKSATASIHTYRDGMWVRGNTALANCTATSLAWWVSLQKKGEIYYNPKMKKNLLPHHLATDDQISRETYQQRLLKLFTIIVCINWDNPTETNNCTVYRYTCSKPLTQLSSTQHKVLNPLYQMHVLAFMV